MIHPNQWEARQVLGGKWVLLWPDTSKGGVHKRRVDNLGQFSELDARAIVEAMELAARVARLNPAAGEMGAGMLADLVERARRIVPAK